MGVGETWSCVLDPVVKIRYQYCSFVNSNMNGARLRGLDALWLRKCPFTHDTYWYYKHHIVMKPGNSTWLKLGPYLDLTVGTDDELPSTVDERQVFNEPLAHRTREVGRRHCILR